MNNNDKKNVQNANNANNGDMKKKIEEHRKDWAKEWALEKQTEGLDAVQNEDDND